MLREYGTINNYPEAVIYKKFFSSIPVTRFVPFAIMRASLIKVIESKSLLYEMGKAKIVKKRNVGKSNNVEYKAVDIQRAYLGYQFGLAYMEMYGKSIFPMDEVSNNILSILKVYGDNFFIEEDGRKVILTLAESIGY